MADKMRIGMVELPDKETVKRAFVWTGTKVFVTIMIVLTVLFICANLFLLWTDHKVSDTLIISSFAFFTCEALAMAGIKIVKVRNGQDD